MSARCASLGLAALLAVSWVAALAPRCPALCPSCREPPPCPDARCPVPTCPSLPDIPSCPVPQCPPLPPIPACPAPVLNLSCPDVSCPEADCPPCPACSDPPSCAPCTTVPAAAAATDLDELPTSPAPAAALSSAEPARRGPPPGYVLWEPSNRFYRLFRSSRSWEAANRTCTRDDAYLALPKNQAELDKMLDVMRDNNLRFLHLGFYRPDSRKPFVTVLGDTVDDTQKAMWKKDIVFGFDCAYLSKHYRKISAQRCSDFEAFICESPS